MSNNRYFDNPDDIQNTGDIYAFALDELERDEPHTVGEKERIFDTQESVRDERFGSRQPIGIVTSEDVENIPLPNPVRVVNGQAQGVRTAHGGEVKYRPRQPRSTAALVTGLVAAVLTILFIIYSALVASGTIGEPAVMMYGSTTNTGKIMQGASNNEDAPHNAVEKYKDQQLAPSYVEFREKVYSALKPMYESYAILGDELAQGGIPNASKIKELNNQAQAAAQTAQANISQISIPEGAGGDVANYLNKVLLAASAGVTQALNTSEAIDRAADGDASAYADAGLSAQNMIRNKENIFADFNRADKAVGIVSADAQQPEQSTEASK